MSTLPEIIGRDRPQVIVVDDFYPEPDAVRARALDLTYVSYLPPDPDVVGLDVARENAHRRGPWKTTAFVVYHGKTVKRPFYGVRHNTSSVRKALEQAIGAPVRDDTWLTGGDYWNGAFHLLGDDFRCGDGVIHHHYKPGDLENQGWSGVVYLSPDAPPSAGTSFWRNKASGHVASFDEPFSLATEPFELIEIAENRYNRLVLFRENVWHRVEHGFGTGLNARLTQTFFFEVA